MLGRSLSPTRGKDSAVIGLRWSIIYSLVGLLVFFGASAFAAEVATDAPNYLIGTTVDIDGSAFGPDEFVTVQVTELDGTPIAGASGMPWSVSSDALGGFVTTWLVDYQGTSSELLLTATGQESGATASTTFVAGSTNLDQLQNGTTTTAPKWANGNINSSNSCYSEGRVVPYRAFITADTGSHFFTIEMEWTKANVHAFDYLGSYDFSEDSAITLAGGPCGDSGTTAPADCVAPTDSLVFPDPDTVSNYSGSIPGDFYPSTYEYNDTHYLMAYNAIIDSVGKYYFGGTASDRTWSVEVYYTQVDTGTVGFYWGGNLSQGDTTHWGVGNGSASVAGAPYHMRMKDFDGGGGANQDRSIQNGTICLPPEGEIVIDADSLCNDLDSTYTASDTSGGGAWLWSVTNGTIVGDSTLSSVDFTVDPGATSVTVHLNVCNTTGGCPGDFCCADLEVTLPTKSCCIPPVVSCPSDDTLFVCDLSPICVDGFTSSDDDGDLANCTVSLGTLNGTEVCFTPVEGANTITYICTDSCDLADTCETTIYVVLNSAPNTPTCPAGVDLVLCDLTDSICVDGFSCNGDPDGNFDYSYATGGVLNGGTVCLLPVEGANVITYICVDSCGDSSYCQTTVNVTLDTTGPEVTCPANISVVQCDLTDICIDGFSSVGSVSCSVDLGTLTGSQVCFTPVEGDNVITYTCVDSCGNESSCQTTVNVTLDTTGPEVTCPANVSVVQCDLTDICIDGFSSVGSVSCSVDLGTLTGSQVCFTPVEGDNVITYTCVDSCGNESSCQTTVNVTLDTTGPEVTCPANVSVVQCDLTDICIDGFSSVGSAS
ncbi:MAG: hypothetical protein OEV80_05335, partial [candidate division Zixibacteria bacterium]|nr:hypothetical protein [candidate division Zixibacteria bacterium]